MGDKMWFSRSEAAVYLGVSRAVLDIMARRGIVGRYRAGGMGAPKFKKAELDRCMTKQWKARDEKAEVLHAD
jgi:hypothetical protein